MNGRFNRIFAYLNRKKDEQFSGSIKLSFESGVCAVVFVFEDGKITEYSYSKTYKGDTLKKFLGG